MKVPSFLYGTKTETKKECRKVIKKVLKGIPLKNAVAEYDLLDTKIIKDGLFILDSGPIFENTYKHFFFNWLIYIYEEEINKIPLNEKNKIEENIFFQFLENEWSILGLCQPAFFFATTALPCNDGRHRWQPYIKKMCEYWDVFCNEDNRFTIGLEYGTLWKNNTMLRGMLIFNFDIPMNIIDNLSEPIDLRKLCDEYKIFEIDVVNDPKFIEKYPYKI